MRIRTVKPEFWESETIASLCRDARLLFLACLNAADDEGLLRWNPSYLKALAFIYDDEVSSEQVSEWMGELVREQLIFPYVGGKINSKYGWIVSFREHQKINRPMPSKLPAPSLQNPKVREAYARRDSMTCQVTGERIMALSERHRGDKHSLSMDHIKPLSKGGTDHPSNIRSTTQSANKGRGNNEDYEASDYVMQNPMNHSVNDSVSESLTERKGSGKEVERKGKELMSDDSDENEIPQKERLLDVIWKMFPAKSRNRSSMKKLTSAWRAISRKPAASELIENLTAWSKTDQWQNEQGQYLEAVDRFIKSEKWRDKPEEISEEAPQQPIQTNQGQKLNYL